MSVRMAPSQAFHFLQRGQEGHRTDAKRRRFFACQTNPHANRGGEYGNIFDGAKRAGEIVPAVARKNVINRRLCERYAPMFNFGRHGQRWRQRNGHAWMPHGDNSDDERDATIGAWRCR